MFTSCKGNQQLKPEFVTQPAPDKQVEMGAFPSWTTLVNASRLYNSCLCPPLTQRPSSVPRQPTQHSLPCAERMLQSSLQTSTSEMVCSQCQATLLTRLGFLSLHIPNIHSLPFNLYLQAVPWDDTGSMTLLAEGMSLKDGSSVLAKIAATHSNASMCIEREAHMCVLLYNSLSYF